FCREVSGFPAYLTLTDSSVSTFPLDHRSACPFSSPSLVLATWISRAVCFCPRSPLRATFTHESRGLTTSMTGGFSRYSHRSSVGVSCACAERVVRITHERARIMDLCRRISIKFCFNKETQSVEFLHPVLSRFVNIAMACVNGPEMLNS